MGWKKSCCVGIIIIFILYPATAIEMNDFVQYLNSSKIIYNVDEIDYNKYIYSTPNKTESENVGHISGWIKIIGYKGSVKIENNTYINNSLNPNPIYEYDFCDIGITSTDHITNNNIDYIKIIDERIIIDNNNTLIEIDVHLKWHHSTLNSRTVEGRTYKWIDKDYYDEYATFSAIETTPLTYPNINNNVINVVVYNISISPKTIVHIPDNNPYILGYKISLNNESVDYYLNALSINKNEYGVPVCEKIDLTSQSIYEESDLFYRVGNKIYINSTDVSELKIAALTPYAAHNMNYTVSNYNEKDIVEKSQLSNIFFILISIWCVIIIYKRFMRI